ncbi:cytochrome C554 [bacterium]|nr:cytochrome C554 [bacterium]
MTARVRCGMVAVLHPACNKPGGELTMLRVLTTLIAALIVLSFATTALAEDYQYIGAYKCFMCHKKDKSGNQMQNWLDGPHSKAYETLASEESHAIAKEMGLGDPQKADECLKCHVTDHDAPASAYDDRFKAKDKSDDHFVDGVGCEACHGPGSEYKSMKAMKDITAGELDGATVGLWTPDEALCVSCHNEESPTFKGFDLEEYMAEIAHPIPADYLAEKYGK